MAARVDCQKDLRRVLQSENPIRFTANIFTLLYRLKEVGNFAPGNNKSPKTELLLEHLKTIRDNGKKVLILSQYDRLGTKKIEKLLEKEGINFMQVPAGMAIDEVKKSISLFKSKKEIVAFRTDDKIPKLDFGNFNVPYIIRFDQWWNPTASWELEDMFSTEVDNSENAGSINVYNYDLMGSIDEGIRESTSGRSRPGRIYLYVITRFGRRVTLAKDDRLELQHLKVVVEESRFEADGEIKACGLDPERLRRYQEEILKGELRPDETYHYGHRLRTYFGVDTLLACAGRLNKDPEDRKCYVALWDTVQDLTAPGGRPCLVSLYFRKFEDRLTLSAAFRTHNALDAWPLNVYGLMAVQGWVAARAGLHPGAITVISHSISIDPKELDRALAIVGQRKWQMRLDPMGYFRVTLDVDDILVEHRFEDVTLKEYRGKTAVAVQHQLARDVALSDINHSMYLGRQLARAEMALKEGREFVQD